MFKNRIKKLKIDVSPDPFVKEMQEKGIEYVHGTNSNALEGIAKFRAVLSMKEIDATPWFHRNGGLNSGERGYTLEGLSTDQPISNGVSLNSVWQYFQSLDHYSKFGLKDDAYPVLIGFGFDIPLSDKITEHSLSVRGIGIDSIAAIYVPRHKISTSVIKLNRIPTLADKVYPLPMKLSWDYTSGP